MIDITIKLEKRELTMFSAEIINQYRRGDLTRYEAENFLKTAGITLTEDNELIDTCED